MKKVILIFTVIAIASLACFTFTAQANNNATVCSELTGEEYVQVAFNDLPSATQETLLAEFTGYEFKAIFQNVETKLLKVVVAKGEEEKTFVQNEEGKFVEQK